MKKIIAIVFCYVLFITIAQAQSKVFKEVSDEISSQMKIITQDDALIGYLVFTQLEKTDKDSFNYKISIMDENLNDIGSFNFKEENLALQDVSFEQDILCLAYLKSNIKSLKGANMRTFRKAVNEAKNSVFTQFINLQGKIIQSGSYDVELKTSEDLGIERMNYTSGIVGSLKHGLILKNIPKTGFVCFYGDDMKNKLLAFDVKGNNIWKKDIQDAQAFGLLSSGTYTYLISKKKTEMLEGGYEIRGFNVNDGTAYDRFVLKDKKGNDLKVLGFENDPATGKPFISGNIIDSRRGNNCITAKQLTKGTYDGVFTIALNGPKKSDIKETFSYWNDGSQEPAISRNALYAQNQSFSRFSSSVRDFNGNTYFVGSSYIKRVRWGNIISSVVLSPLIIVSPLLLASGNNKCKITEAMLLKQDASGKLSFDNSIPCDQTRFFVAKSPFNMYDTKKFYSVSNANTKSNFLIVDDEKNVVIYNINSKKTIRKVPHRDGNIRTYIFPAKEGHIMVSEFNKKEKYTRLSIEAL